jgi:type II secretory pathway pseudopilin PulG
MTIRRIPVEPPASCPLCTVRRSRGFTLIEMLTSVALLIILLGLMVSLARNVRDQSAQHLTKQILRQLAVLVDEYAEANGRQLPPVTPIIPANLPIAPEEPSLELLAKRNNEDFVRALRPELARLDRRQADHLPTVMAELPASVFDGVTLRDAWGSPIVFMPDQHPWIGMAPKRREGESYFFFSAGPDRAYLTRSDNLYSYETVGE